MQRIRQLDQALYHMIRLRNLRARALGRVHAARRQARRDDVAFAPVLPFLLRLRDLLEYLDVTYPEFLRLLQQWDEYCRRIETYRDSQSFYLDWVGEMGRSNLCANLVNQSFSYGNLYSYLVATLRGRHARVCDYGCGTAVFSLSLDEAVGFSSVGLYDVDNEAARFVRHLLEKHAMAHVRWHDVLAGEGRDQRYDVAICLDVLEHLPRSSDAFLQLDALLDVGGLLVLRAPWGNHPEHLPEAAIDFYRGAAFRALRERYRLVHHFGEMDINAAYRKVR